VVGGNGQAAAEAAERLASAHDALKADTSIQFRLESAPPPPEPPQWLKELLDSLAGAFRPVGRFVNWIGSFMPDAPVARFIFWSMLVLAAVAILWIVYERIRHGKWRLPSRRTAPSVEPSGDEEEWAPEAAPARSWLREADALAAEGRYAEAARHLLFRSVEDIERRRPKLVRPALTSRELASAEAIPAAARGPFARIARVVEISLFGGRPVEEGDWASARQAYADLVLPGAWRG